MPLTNHFEAEGLIIQRLKAKAIPGILNVLPGSTVAGETNLAQYCDSLFVEPHEGVYSPNVNDGRIQLESQHWQITALVKNLADETATASELAGSYITQILQALVGWPPSKQLATLAITGRPVPFYSLGWAQFPIILNTSFAIIGDQT